jgi:hypothetical protein
MKKLMLLLLWIFPLFSTAQEKVRFYYIKPINLDTTSKKKLANLIVPVINGANVKVYAMRNQLKKDSILADAEDFKMWQDTVSFSYTVPEFFLEGTTCLSITPIYNVSYKAAEGSGKQKGDRFTSIGGNQDVVKPILLKIKSEPTGALAPYIVGNPTNAITRVQEYVYIVVFAIKDTYKTMECRPNHLMPLDSVFKKLN